MGLQTLILFGIVSISVVNICTASPPFFDANGNLRMMWTAGWQNPTTTGDFLAKAQEIAAAKVNKGFEMKKEGIKIAQQSMMNKFAMMGADESKKATTIPPTTPEAITSDELHYPTFSTSEEELINA